MDAEKFSQAMIEIMALPSPQRHPQLANQHTKVYTAYIAALQAISSEEAAAPVNSGDDKRTLAQVVGHIFAWDRFGIQVAGQLLSGVLKPKLFTNLEGFVERDGTILNFKDVDDFNAYHANQQASGDWVQLQLEAMDTAAVLHALFTQPDLLTYEQLDRAQPHTLRLQDGARLKQSTIGWSLWVLQLQHYAVEHAGELTLEVVL